MRFSETNKAGALNIQKDTIYSKADFLYNYVELYFTCKV